MNIKDVTRIKKVISFLLNLRNNIAFIKSYVIICLRNLVDVFYEKKEIKYNFDYQRRNKRI